MSKKRKIKSVDSSRVSLLARCTGQSSLLLILSVVTATSLAVAGYAGYRLATIQGVPKDSERELTSDEDQQTGPVAAWVNGHPITEAYVNAQIASLPVGQQTALLSNMDKFVESLVQEEALFQSVIFNNFNDEPQLRERAKTMVVNGLIEKHVTNGVEVSDEMIQEYYDNNHSTIREEHVAASHIVLEEKSACEKLVTQIDSIATFERMAREQSIDKNTATQGGRIGLFMNHSGDLGFEEQLFEMQVDQMKVFESKMGCHIVRLTDHVIPPLPPLEQVKQRIVELLKRRESGIALQALLQRGVETLDIKRNQ